VNAFGNICALSLRMDYQEYDFHAHFSRWGQSVFSRIKMHSLRLYASGAFDWRTSGRGKAPPAAMHTNEGRVITTPWQLALAMGENATLVSKSRECRPTPLFPSLLLASACAAGELSQNLFCIYSSTTEFDSRFHQLKQYVLAFLAYCA
jgi:hypothetical protein